MSNKPPMTAKHYFLYAALAFAGFVMCGQNPDNTSSNIGAGIVPAIIGIPVVGIILACFGVFVRKDTRR